MDEQIQFQASIEGSSCIKMDGDGAVTLKLSVPASETAAMMELFRCRELPLKVTVERSQ